MVCPNDSTVDYNSGDAGGVPLVQNLYQGMAQDPVTGLYYERARWHSPSLGTWIIQDPLQYINGANTYQFVMGNPVSHVDPAGELFGPNTPIGNMPLNLFNGKVAHALVLVQPEKEY